MRERGALKSEWNGFALLREMPRAEGNVERVKVRGISCVCARVWMGVPFDAVPTSIFEVFCGTYFGSVLFAEVSGGKCVFEITFFMMHASCLNIW